jgi:hypothetical protein
MRAEARSQNSEVRSQEFRKKDVGIPLTRSLTASVPIIPPLWPLCDAFPWRVVLRTKQWCLPTRLHSQPPSQSFPLCGLRDLCAMLSPGESFSHRNSGVSRRGFSHSLRPNHSPLWPPPQWECRGISAPLLPTRKSKSTPWSAWRT